MEKLNWIFDLKSQIPEFLNKLKLPEPGRYKYSLTGDCVENSLHWGLGQAVFASKIYYMLNMLEEQVCNELASYIISFQDDNGYIFDPEVERLSRLRRIANAIRNRDFNNFFNEQTKRAETRQSFAALRCLGSRANIPFLHIPYTKDGITKYINQLDWTKPWSAGSHVSHLLFFLNNNRILFNVYQNDADELIDYAIQVANHYQQEDGSWYAKGRNNIPVFQKVNSAMKMMTAFDAAKRYSFGNPEGLIDLCLVAINDEHACNSFNVICVLYHCSKKTNYRKDEIKKYSLERLDLYRKHYWAKHGGFSFFEGRANDIYYGAKISKGLAEPDIHGTVLFLWGIVLISKILNLNNDLNFKVPIT